ncbi:hypothetical protein N7475_006561 [Penicillium sp. IBT 31633x]|nr:hypothetical protein N7475_006561 [Penicillium sp. IBT 31633x]
MSALRHAIPPIADLLLQDRQVVTVHWKPSRGSRLNQQCKGIQNPEFAVTTPPRTIQAAIVGPDYSIDECMQRTCDVSDAEQAGKKWRFEDPTGILMFGPQAISAITRYTIPPMESE